MKVSCQACGAKYTISDDKVRGRKVKIRCKSCGTPIVVDGANPAEAGAADAAAPQPAGAPAAAVSEAPPAAAVPGGDTSWSVNLSETDQRTMTTAEIVAGWKDGTVTHDAFVWKDGMGDWVAIGECAELKAVLPVAAAATGTPFGPTVVTAPTPARLSGGRAGAGVDLFDAVPPGEEEDVATSAPHLPAAGQGAYDDGKMTGARNENSVLFSLDSLKGGLAGQAPAAKKPEPKRPGASAPMSSGDPFAMSPTDIGGGNPLFSLNANQALLTAPAPPEPPPPRVEAVGGVAAKPMNKLLVYGGGGAAAVLLLVVGLVIGRSGGSDTPATDASAKALASAEPEKKEEKKEEKKAEEEKKEEATAPATGSPSASAAPTAPTKVGGTTGGTTPPTGTKKPDATDTKKPDGATMPSTGGGPFSVSAAQVALTQAAANAASCAKPGGPTGSGKAQVTFAPSGRVTSANVATPPFAGTPVGGCVAGVFRRARIPAFSGEPVTVSKSFSVK
jgi:predicted Zn finger-like uncharacterized protein